MRPDGRGVSFVASFPFSFFVYSQLENLRPAAQDLAATGVSLEEALQVSTTVVQPCGLVG